jgi:replication factor C small subunit
MKELIWYEKYRPKELKQLALDENTLELLESYLENGEIPHLMFYGPAGSGKTTISMILINALASARLLLNASSDDRGIATVKTKVKQFAAAKTLQKNKVNIVLFDEADGLTPDSQMALKNTIETFHKNCRFIFTCNQIDKVIEPIKSRCVTIHFETPPETAIIKHCRKILKKEKIKSNRKNIKTIVQRYYPDVRSIINNLQSCSISGKLSPDNYLDRFNPSLFPSYIQNGLLFALRSNWSDVQDFTRLYKALATIIAGDEECGLGLSNETRPEALLIIAEYLYKDRTIADRELNFTACVIEIMNLLDVKIDFKTPF